MDRPDFTRRQGVDRFFDEYGGDVHGGPHPDVPTGGTGFCGLEWRPLADGRLLVIAYEHPDNPGRSVTHAAEEIAGQFAETAGVDVSRLVWVESYGAERPTPTGAPPAEHTGPNGKLGGAGRSPNGRRTCSVSRL